MKTVPGILAVVAALSISLRAEDYDIVIYGGTAAAVIAAVQAKQMGKSVIIVSPDKHLGGLSAGGLGFTDTGNKGVIGGLARDFYHRVWQHYDADAAWKWQKKSEYGGKGQGTPAIDGAQRTMWIFEPHVAEQVFENYVKEFAIPVVRDEWLDRATWDKKGFKTVDELVFGPARGVLKEGTRITAIRTLSGKTYTGRMFIDATYEGDLMAAAGVSYHVGREANAVYGEKWNGVQVGVLHHRHHFGAVKERISPYIVPGDPQSGLLARISAEPPGEYGAGDKRVQAYCFRLCLTNHEPNRVPFPKPEGYDPKQYELLLRVFAAGWRETFEKFDPIPNHKTDTNNHGPFSFDNIGMSYDYPEASYERRREIIKEHETYQKGWLYFVANDPRVPADVQSAMQKWGLAKDEFTDNGNWPHQLYIREARRMVGSFVMTENELLKKKPTPDSVGMGSYTIDSHNVQRYITPEGYVQNEGDIGVPLSGPYEIAYGSLIPKRGEVENLFVPVAMSASHIAYGSIRMEPVFMILGQSAATAAVLAIDAKQAVQEVPYAKLRERLLADGQILEHADSARSPRGGRDPERLGGIDSTLSPFGIGSCYVNGRSLKDMKRWMPQMATIGLQVLRTCHTSWDAIEPEEGKWSWNELDQQMKFLEENKITCGALLLGSPGWNKLDKPGHLPVNNLPAWSRYVTELVKHLKGRVKYYEVWNEPPNFTGRDQTPADYAKLVVATYDAAKAVDPDCLVGLAAKSAHINYLEQVIQAGAKDHFDWITLHPYEVLDGIASNIGTEVTYLRIVPTLRKMLAAQNPARQNVPVIFTELGCDAKKGPDIPGQALIKAYAMGIAQGVTCIQWFEGMDGDSGPMGLLKSDGTPRPAYTAMAQLLEHLGQHPTYLGWVMLNETGYGFVFQGAKTTVLVAWARKGTRVQFGQAVSLVNPLTGQSSSAESHELTTSPIFALGVPEDLVARARANRDKPLLWGGDYANAKSVSVTMGERNLEKGLHTMSGDAVAEAVVAYGGSARAGSVPGGNVFMVDPDFLSYTSTPIEISAVVRRNAANDNAGFKLVYESTRGFKTAGTWYTVPDNKEWHTVRWTINDPQFVNDWGYNFALESDGNVYNKYLIQSVTVTKLDRSAPRPAD